MGRTLRWREEEEEGEEEWRLWQICRFYREKNSNSDFLKTESELSFHIVFQKEEKKIMVIL